MISLILYIGLTLSCVRKMTFIHIPFLFFCIKYIYFLSLSCRVEILILLYFNIDAHLTVCFSLSRRVPLQTFAIRITIPFRLLALLHMRSHIHRHPHAGITGCRYRGRRIGAGTLGIILQQVGRQPFNRIVRTFLDQFWHALINERYGWDLSERIVVWCKRREPARALFLPSNKIGTTVWSK